MFWTVLILMMVLDIEVINRVVNILNSLDNTCIAKSIVYSKIYTKYRHLRNTLDVVLRVNDV